MPKALIVQSSTDSPAIAVAQKHSIAIIELSPVAEGDTGVFLSEVKSGQPYPKLGLLKQTMSR